VTDLPFSYPETTPPNLGAAPPKRCRRHSGLNVHFSTDGDERQFWHVQQADGLRWCEEGRICTRCWKRLDPAASRRGRLNRQRGNAIEREIGKRLGLRRVGQYGGPDDLTGELFAAQVKSGGAFSERLWSWLKAVPVNAGQTPLLVVTDAPGPGHRRRAVVILDIDDWADLHRGEPSE
jgi:hypothetical protein